MKNQYFASLNISICLEAEQECGVVIQVLNETLLPKGPCDWTTGFLQQSKSFVFFSSCPHWHQFVVREAVYKW